MVLNLVDLAGSERVGRSGSMAVAERLKEATFINRRVDARVPLYLRFLLRLSTAVSMRALLRAFATCCAYRWPCRSAHFSAVLLQ